MSLPTLSASLYTNLQSKTQSSVKAKSYLTDNVGRCTQVHTDTGSR